MRKKDDEKARSIKAAVVKMILQEGFQGASISKIAKMAGVSPATVYIYFENKENMLQDIYREYSEDIFAYLLDGVKKGMDGHQFIDLLVRSYYNYMLTHKEVFNYVEQFSNCPSLVNGCSGRKGVSKIYNLIEEMKKNHMMKDYSNEILLAMIFSPVKALAIDAQKSEVERGAQLQELITIIQDAVLTEPPKSAIIVQE